MASDYEKVEYVAIGAFEMLKILNPSKRPNISFAQRDELVDRLLKELRFDDDEETRVWLEGDIEDHAMIADVFVGLMEQDPEQ